MQLGSVLAPDAKGPKGPDLVVKVKVPRGAVGLPEGYVADVPEYLPLAGERVRRQLSPLDEGTQVRLQIPAGFPENGALKLRGQGGVEEGRPPGDLIVKIALTDGPLPVPVPSPGRRAGSSALRAVIALAIIAAAAGVWAFVR